MTPHLFLSHSAKDDPLADRIDRELREGNVSTWLDHVAIRPGDDWDREIGRALRTCQSGCFLLTPNSELSDECRAEWRTILHYEKRLFVVMFGKIHNFPWRLRNFEYVDLNDDFLDGLRVLARSVRLQISAHESAVSLERTDLVETPVPIDRQRQRLVRVTVDMTVEVFKQIARRFLRFIARLLGLRDDDIGLGDVRAGSTIVHLRMPDVAATLLTEVFQEEPEAFVKFKVLDIGLLYLIDPTMHRSAASDDRTRTTGSIQRHTTDTPTRACHSWPTRQ